MSWLRLLPVLMLAATAIACEKRSLHGDAGTGTIQTGTAGSAGNGSTGVAGSTGSTGSVDARPDIPTITESPDPCGNGRLEPGEECDDANKAPRDGCNRICQIECFESCGGCGTSQPCVTTTFCGNARIDEHETCDDWNNYPGDGCSAACLIEVGWHCPVIGFPCAPICGDGRVVGAEGCDDGDTVAGDGCNELCQREPTLGLCGDGSREGSEECDFGIANNDQAYKGCSTSCRWIACGDGVVNGPEECDLGVDQNRARYGGFDGCTPLCTFPHFCGDGHADVENGEQCDLGAKNGGISACTTDCKVCVDCPYP